MLLTLGAQTRHPKLEYVSILGFSAQNAQKLLGFTARRRASTREREKHLMKMM